MLKNLDKIMHLPFNFDACPMHSPFGFMHLTHQNLSARALFCLNPLAKANMQLLICNHLPLHCNMFNVLIDIFCCCFGNVLVTEIIIIIIIIIIINQCAFKFYMCKRSIASLDSRVGLLSYQQLIAGCLMGD